MHSFDKDDPFYKLDIEKNLRIYLPPLFVLLGNNKISWSKINKTYQKLIFRRMEIMAEQNKDTLSVEANFLDIITQAIKGDTTHFPLIYFLNSLIKDLSKMLDEREKKETAKTVYNLLIEPDKYYLNFTGEFASLWKFKQAGYRLLKTEIPLDDKKPMGVKIDFALIKDKKFRLVEIVNIHLDDNLSKKDAETVINLISNKIIAKKETIKSDIKKAWLFPVLWGNYDSINKVNDCVKAFNLSFPDTFEFNAYMSYSSTENSGQHKFRFGSISKLMG